MFTFLKLLYNYMKGSHLKFYIRQFCFKNLLKMKNLLIIKTQFYIYITKYLNFLHSELFVNWKQKFSI